MSDHSQMIGVCFGCTDSVPNDQLLSHVQRMHPDVWATEAPERWPDGEFVVIDDTLEPEEFA